MATVQIAEESPFANRNKLTVKVGHVPTQETSAKSSQQFKHCRLRQGKYHKVDTCKFASKKLTTIRETSFRSRYVNCSRSPRARDRHSTRFGGRFQCLKCDAKKTTCKRNNYSRPEAAMTRVSNSFGNGSKRRLKPEILNSVGVELPPSGLKPHLSLPAGDRRPAGLNILLEMSLEIQEGK